MSGYNDDLVSDMSRLGSKPVKPKKSWEHILEDYMKRHDEKRHSKLTVIKYEQVIRDFVSFAGTGISRDKIRDYIRTLQLGEQHLKITINKHITILKTFFSWAVKQKLLDRNPMTGIESLRGEKRLRTVLHRHQVEALYKEAEKDPHVLGQDLVMFDVFYGTGIRTNELVNIDQTDLDTASHTIRIRVAKGGSERIVAVPKQVYAHLMEYLVGIKLRFPTSNVLFPNSKGKRINPRYVYERIQRILIRLLSEKKGAHTLRHSFATVMINEGAPLPAVQKQLGHKSAATTQIYDHSAVDRLKKVHQTAHPKK